MNRHMRGMAISVFGALLILPPAAAFAQCNTKIDPPRKSTQGLPGERVCCSLGTQTGIDPGNLRGHQYGNQATLAAQTAGNYGGEPDGYVYTAAAGMVDIGHVRDNADMVLFVYTQLIDAQHTIYIGDQAAVPVIPTSPAQMLALAGSIVFVNSWAHELTTWGDTNMMLSHKAQDFSAFSPEDMSSNIVGIEAATEAIGAGGGGSAKDFDEKMDAILPALLAKLGAQSLDVTNQMLVNVKYIPQRDGTDLTGKWWMDDKLSPGNLLVRLLRRNFDGQAWKIVSGPQATTPDWLNTTRFSLHYSEFLYFVSDKTDVDATQVPKTNAYARASGFTTLEWAPTTAFTKLIPDAIEVAGLAGASGPCLATPANKVIPYGQYIQTKINVDPGEPQDVIWTFAHATQFLRDAFVAPNLGGNADMDGPVKYEAPPAATPAKK